VPPGSQPDARKLTCIKAEPEQRHQIEAVRTSNPRLARERRTVRTMIRLFCRFHHGGRTLCADCHALSEYADSRLDGCPYGEGKPACLDCPIHCYDPARRDQIRRVMRWAGPRMLWRHPVLALLHLLDDRHTKHRPLPRR
jgi:hypothetical protein